MGEAVEDRRRAPGKSVLHEASRRGWPAVSSLVPQRVKQEVERYLCCGDVRCGFVEVSCGDCHDSRLVAFSCKGRGCCPSCTTRRALETGAHLESLLPRVAHRQWTLSLPRSVRFVVVKQPALLELRLVKAVWRLQRATARRLGWEGRFHGGAVCFWQWFGSSLQLTPHLHLLLPEAQWQGDGALVPLPPPSDEEVTAVLARVLRQAKKDWAALDAGWAEDEYEELQQRAIQERLCRYGARGPVAESRLCRLEDGRYQYTPKKGVTFTTFPGNPRGCRPTPLSWLSPSPSGRRSRSPALFFFFFFQGTGPEDVRFYRVGHEEPRSPAADGAHWHRAAAPSPSGPSA